MAATPTAVQTINQDGVDPTYAAIDKTEGNIFVNNGKTFFHVVVADDAAGTLTCTFNCVNPCNYGFDHDIIETIGVGDEVMIGPFQTARYNDSVGKVTVTYTGDCEEAKATHAVLSLNL